MKKVLFIGVTKFDFEKSPPLHLQKKFLGLSKGTKPYLLGRGRPFHKKIWGADVYLLPQGIFFWPLAFFLTVYLCLVKRIDVIISQSPLLEGFLGSILKILFKKELIVEIHGDWEDGPFLSKKRRFESFQRKFIPAIARFSFKNADKIRGVARYLIKRAKEIAPKKPYFLFPTFTDLEIFLKESSISYNNYILFVGQLEEVKGTEYLIDAFAKTSKDFPDFKLIIIGEGEERENLKSKVKDLKLLDRVEFKGKLSLEETKNIMKDCYCLVLPSLSEGLPRVLLEAQALSKPLIASEVGGIPELIEDGQTGFLFEVGNSNELAEKLKILIKNRDLAIKIGRIGKNFVAKNFSNEKYMENYIQMINN